MALTEEQRKIWNEIEISEEALPIIHKDYRIREDSIKRYSKKIAFKKIKRYFYFIAGAFLIFEIYLFNMESLVDFFFSSLIALSILVLLIIIDFFIIRSKAHVIASHIIYRVSATLIETITIETELSSKHSTIISRFGNAYGLNQKIDLERLKSVNFAENLHLTFINQLGTNHYEHVIPGELNEIETLISSLELKTKENV